MCLGKFSNGRAVLPVSRGSTNLSERQRADDAKRLNGTLSSGVSCSWKAWLPWRAATAAPALRAGLVPSGGPRRATVPCAWFRIRSAQEPQA